MVSVTGDWDSFLPKKLPKIDPLLLVFEVAVPVVGLVTSFDSVTGEVGVPSVVLVTADAPVVPGKVSVGAVVIPSCCVARGAPTTRAASPS